MRRRPALLLVGLLVLLGGLTAAAVAFRVALAEAVIENQLAAYGLDSVRLQLDTLGRDQARLVALRAGDHGELQAQSVVIRYDLPRLFEGPPLAAVEAVVIEGLVLRLDLTGGGPPLGSLQGLLDREGEMAGGGGLALPPISLRNARVEADTPLGTIGATLEGTLGPAPDGRLAASLALSAAGGPGRLAGTVFAEASPEGTASGSLVIDDGSLTVSAVEGEPPIAVEGLSGALAFSLEDWQPVSLTGDFVIAGLQHPGGTADSASLSFDMTPSQADVEAQFDAADGRAHASVTLSLQDYRAQPVIEAHLTAEAAADAHLLGLLPPPHATAGQGALELRLAGRLAPFERLGKASPSALPAPPILQPLVGWLDEGDVTMEMRLGLDAVELPNSARGVTATLETKIAMADDGLVLDVSKDAHLSVEALAPDWLAELGLPPELVALLQDGGALTIKAAGEPAPQLRLYASDDGPAARLAGAADITLNDEGATSLSVAATLSGTPESFAGTADVTAITAQVETGGARIVKAAAHLPLAVEGTADQLRLSLTAPGRLAADRIEQDDVKSIQPAATLESGWLEASLSQGAATFEHEIAVRPEHFRLSVPGAHGPIDLALGRLVLSGSAAVDMPYQGKARLASGSAKLDALAVAIDDLSGEAQFDASFTQASADLAATVTKYDDALPLVPLAVTGRLTRKGAAVRLTGEASPESDIPELAALRLPISARYDLDKARGEVTLKETALLFAPGGLQPRHLLPALVELANVTGEAKVGGSMALGARGEAGSLAETARLSLQDLSFRSGSNQVTGLDLALALDSLQPPASQPGQRLTIARVESVLPIEDIEATFQLPAADEPQVRLERLTFHMAGGSFEAQDTLLVPAAARQAIAFEVTGLEIAPLFEALSVSGLTGSGTLDGRIPLALEGEEVAVEGGHLESRAPGILAYNTPFLQSSLPPDADDLALLQSPVDMAIIALGNFHYDKLTLDLDKATAGETDLKLHIEGKNPELLGGYPFVFNISLKGNLNPLIAALRQGTGLTDEMIRRTWKATP